MGTASSLRERPMTSQKGAGYNPGRKRSPEAHTVYPLFAAGSPAPRKAVDETSGSGGKTREDQIRELEATIHDSVDAVAEHLSQEDTPEALRVAKRTVQDYEALSELREPDDDSFSELAGSVWLTLALAFEAAGMETEAIETYTTLLRNQDLGDYSRFRVNLGNIHFRKGECAKALKMYRMALDKLPESQRRLKNEVIKNIAVMSLKMGKAKEAVEQYERLLEQGVVDAQIMGDLMLCYAKLNGVEALQKLFAEAARLFSLSDSDSRLSDPSAEERDRCLVASVDLIASKEAEEQREDVYDACIEVLKRFGLKAASHEVLLSKAGARVSQERYEEAIHLYKEIEKKDEGLRVPVSMRLACLYALKGDAESAASYAQSCTKLDRYSHECWINKGNAHFSNGDLPRAKACYEEALHLDPESTEALYNYGLATKKLAEDLESEDSATALLGEAEKAFRRIHCTAPDFTECVIQIGSLCEMRQRFEEAVEWFELAHSLVPDDPGLLAKLGTRYHTLGDEAKALRHYQDAYEMYPGDMDVLCWLAAFYVNNEMYETASTYFQLAADLQPTEIKWSLMVASCYRRAGLLNEAFERYLEIHQGNPDSVECLRFLIPLCEEIGKGDKRSDFEEKLKQCQKTQIDTSTHTAASKPRLDHLPSKPVLEFESAYGEALKHRGEAHRPKLSALDDWGQGGLGEDLLPL